MNEVWLDIKGFEGYYQVSNFGNVKSLDRFEYYQREDSSSISKRFRKGRLLTPKIDRYGYQVVHLRKLGIVNIHTTIHRLVAEAFIDNPEIKPTVNHKDCNKINNNVENLEWATHSENTKHAFDNGLLKVTPVNSFGEKNVAFKMYPEVISEMFRLLDSGFSKKQVASKLGISERTVERYTNV